MYSNLEPNRKGDISEGYVQCLAQVKGADVLTNVGCTGEIDMVFVVNGNYYPIDVKTASYVSNGVGVPKKWHSRDAYSVPDHVYPVLVLPLTGTDLTGWEVKWLESRTPDGLENFWDKNYFVSTDEPNHTDY